MKMKIKLKKKAKKENKRENVLNTKLYNVNENTII